MRRLACIAFLCAVLAAAPLTAYVTNLLPTRIATQNGAVLNLKLEIANDDASRERGLMHRTRLNPGDGMAFFFPKSSPYRFWMKDTPIPLDMLFVDEQGRIVYIATAKPLSLEPIGPARPVNVVIEIAGGRAAREGISVGDKVSYDTDSDPRLLAR